MFKPFSTPPYLPGKNFLIAFFLFCFISCNNDYVHIGEKEIVEKPEDINIKAEEVIQGTLKDLVQNNKDISDSIKLKNGIIVQDLYEKNQFQPIWSAEGRFSDWGDSLFFLMDSVRNYGLFPQDYYYSQLCQLKKELIEDTSRQNKMDAVKWAYSDLLLTSAFVQIVTDLTKGRLLPDSILQKDTLLRPVFYSDQLNLIKRQSISEFTAGLEPISQPYKNLKSNLRQFLEKANFKEYLPVKAKDSTQIPGLVYKRLLQEDSLKIKEKPSPDSIAIAGAIKKYQKKKGLKADGKITPGLINRLNDTDRERFIRIAITLDKLKILQPLPQQYIWVNIPSFYLQVRDSDSVVLTSRVVVGKPETKTPSITSSITDMITYPKWHIPESIIKKDILPGLKRDPGYTLSKGYTLTDEEGNEIDPYTVKWSKFKESIPYRVVQGSGDENALGVMKFNFPNKYAVYLHDTNQRYLFSKTSRALSHGCVRVQAWQELTHFILRNDSLYSEKAIPIDTVNNWLALKEKHVIPVRKKVPLFIRYLTCEAKEDKIVFYEDVYGEDRRIRETIFSDK